MSTEPKNKGGRPELPPEKRRISYTRRWKPEHLEKLKAAGNPAFETYLDAWQPTPTPKKKPAK